jgi:hypothetical protein
MKLSAMISTAVLAAVGLQTSPAYAAYPITHFNWYNPGWGGQAKGTIIWYNRTVEIQGFVLDITAPGGSTTATFAFPGSTGLTAETRTDGFDSPSTSRSFHFTKTYDHPGGVSRVSLEVCTHDPLRTRSGCATDLPYTRSTP